MNLIYYAGIFPLISFFLLVFFQNQLSNKRVSAVSILFLFLSFCIFVYSVYDYYHSLSTSNVFFIPVFRWLTLGDYCMQFSCIIDFFSLCMLGVVLFISICVYLFSFWYMKDSLEYIKYFMYMNLFVSFMVFFVLASNLMSMFFAWEAVGVCSYLLIGFYMNKKNNGYAAIKSFLMTRIGDVFFLIAIFLIILKFHTLEFFELKYFSKEMIFLNNHTNYLFWMTLFLTVAAIGKSAQVPVHTWLIGAMSGPTPASALIHAATMVVMGIYLIIRTYPLFICSDRVMTFLSIIGCFTILISSLSAIFEKNIKRILAFSTMSQIGYMFVALGSNNVKGAFLHLVSHAFFKSLLFLSAGSIIKHVNNEQDIFKMGGLYKKIPFVYITFLIGSVSLVSLPFITSSFYSKGDILFHLMHRRELWLIVCCFLGVFFTSIYSLRMIFLIFHRQNSSDLIYIKKNVFYYAPLLALSVGCTPVTWNITSNIFSNFFGKLTFSNSEYAYMECITFTISIIGFIATYVFYKYEKFFLKKNFLQVIFYPWYILSTNYWFFDFIYSYLFVRGYINISKYLDSKKFFHVENFFYRYIVFFKMEIFKIEPFSVLYHVRWYLLCLIVSCLIIFINQNHYIESIYPSNIMLIKISHI
ncbi:NADH-quinone oxidoreductase subunit L [Buchnera aphidicola]|uniref:NADH-quinone oxidoreductase subunit L n=1 Tax=Buchnera aphidicola TaxID=9 RepID=UPI00094CD0E2|nr:NADH-quinone oxidoreductase subunit L [Buchnera aphidicola]